VAAITKLKRKSGLAYKAAIKGKKGRLLKIKNYALQNKATAMN